MMSERQKPVRSRTITWHEPVDLAEFGARDLNGLDVLRRRLNSDMPRSPIMVLMDLEAVSYEKGLAVLEGTPGEHHYNPHRVVHGGFAATLLDAALGSAVHTMLEPGFAYTTLELKVNYTRAIVAETGKVRCEARVVHAGRTIVTAEAKVVDSAGKLYAHGVATCMIVPQRSPP
jgi:uncharacterized protein (TIGR00369 family)